MHRKCYIDTDTDTAAHQRVREAWTEWIMFAKTCLLVLHGDKVKENRNNNILANRIARWSNVERMALWKEGLHITKADQPVRSKRKRNLDGERASEGVLIKKQEEVIGLAQRGLPGKAVRHANSLDWHLTHQKPRLK